MTIILKDLNDAYANWNRQAARKNNHLDSLQLIGAYANEGVLCTVLRDEPLSSLGARAEFQSRFRVSGEDTYHIHLDMSFPTIPVYRRTMFQYVADDGQLGIPLDVQTRYEDVRVNWLPPRGGKRQNFILPHQLNCKVEITVGPTFLKVNGEQVADYGIGRGNRHYFKFGCYTDSYDKWPDYLPMDFVRYNSISIEEYLA